ncbi:dopaminechrome tautomerase-like [Eurosta solidaginis]|uniref:dopaminechrome tautomerase-like n=1 Tax=Eurosta solidaginis TaxID=178769 RepID=UPI0035315EA8
MYILQLCLGLLFINCCVCRMVHLSSSDNAQPESNPNNEYKQLQIIFEAKNLEFGFPSESERQAVLNDGRYNPHSVLPIDVDVYYSPKNGLPSIFVTIPRFGPGTPYSLAYLTDVQRPNGTELQPYPSYEWHSSHGRDCNGLTSVCRVHIDPCGRIWILDSGEINNVQFCSPQIVVIDLGTNQLMHRYRLPAGTFKPTISRFVTPYVDVADPPPKGLCQRVFVYMADATGFGIVVYDVMNQHSWRIENKYTYPDPDFSTHTIAGQSFELLEGTIGVTVTPINLELPRFLYFHTFSNELQMAIPLNIVNNRSNWNNGLDSVLSKFSVLGKRGVQCAASAMTSAGVLLCGHYEPIGLFGWDIRTPYTPENRILLAHNPIALQFVSGLKVIKNPWGREEVWMLSNRVQRAFTGTINFNEINYRILRCGVDELLQGRPC